jgi:hypothetical protein
MEILLYLRVHSQCNAPESIAQHEIGSVHLCVCVCEIRSTPQGALRSMKSAQLFRWTVYLHNTPGILAFEQAFSLLQFLLLIHHPHSLSMRCSVALLALLPSLRVVLP